MRLTSFKNLVPFMLAIATSVLSAQSTEPTTQPMDFATNLTLHPSAATQPVSRYRLLPDLTEQTPGNAVLLYLQVRDAFPDQKTTDEVLWPDHHKLDYEDTPIEKFPRQYSERLLATYSEALGLADLAARRQQAIWDTGWLEQGPGGVRPFGYPNPLLHLGNILSFRARFQISQEDWNAAAHTFQTEFSLARQVGAEPMVIQSLRGSGLAQVALANAVEQWIGHGDSPNLYWELTDLPNPFIDLRPIPQTEDRAMLHWEPSLFAALHHRLARPQWPQVIREMIMLRLLSPPDKPSASEIDARSRRLVQSAYARAKEHLLHDGASSKDLEGMSADEVVGTYLCQQYNSAADELWRAWTLPYWQSEPQILRVWHALKPDRSPALDNPLIQSLTVVVDNHVNYTLPAVLRIRYELERPSRQIALLRTIEALRDYAAIHEGQPPERLEQITELPLPIDSLTNKPFAYRLDGRVATLDAPPPFGRSVYSGWRYVLTFEK